MTLDIYTFGEQLIKTQDLDPVYVMLYKANLEKVRLYRWLLAYWCFYHSGTASWIADHVPETNYWKAMEIAAGSKEYPRCPERRHFRGANAIKSVAYLKEQGIEALFGPWLVNQSNVYTVASVMEDVQTWVGFGPWIAFKVADMLERLGICKVKFDDGAMFLFDSPQQGADMLWKSENLDDPPDHVGGWAVKKILAKLGHHKAPPRRERRINCQEAETILCKWKSHTNGHYIIGEDIESLEKSLKHFPESKTSQRLFKACEGILWG